MTLYYLGRALFRIVFRIIYRYRVEGMEVIPQEGPVILCCNHFSWWDPPLVGSANRRPVHFMAKEELFRLPVLGSLLPKVGAFPVQRGTADRTAVKRALAILGRGGVVGLFPEGTRSRTGKLLPAEAGAALLAIHSGATVVPVAIRGPYRAFRPVRIRFGQPLDLSAYKGRKLGSKELQEIANGVIMARIAAMLNDMENGHQVGRSAATP